MSDQQVLYRKYRPSSFDEVRGQAHIVSVLKESISKGGVSHAYLFSGTRGTGKTSIARILAKEIGTDDVDIYEIDAASHTGVDDIREINEAVHTLPYKSSKKVYIIDEVHMLSKSAFNALLKTLEEPPAHVLFVLATTEMHKLPDTVISRCELHRFKKPTHTELVKLVGDVAQSEGVSIDDEGARLIAHLGDGSYRDTLGVLQKVLRSRSGKKLTHSDIEAITGAPSTALLNDILIGISEKDSEKALSAVEKALGQNIDIAVLLSLLLERVRSVLLLRYAKDMHKEIKENLGSDEYDFLMNIARDTSSAVNSSVLEELLNASTQMRFASMRHIPLELALMRIIENNAQE